MANLRQCKITFVFYALQCVCLSFLLIACNRSKDTGVNETICKKFIATADEQYKTGKNLRFTQQIDSFFAANKGKTGPSCKIEMYGHKLWYYMHQNSGYDSALIYNDSLRITIEKNDLIDKDLFNYIDVYSSRGAIYYLMGNFDSAYDNYFKAKQLAGKSGNTCAQYRQCHGLGMICYKQEKYADAVAYFKSTFIYAQSCSEQPVNMMQEALDNVALSFEKQGLPDSALYYYDSALTYIKKNISRFELPLYAEKGIGVIYGNMGAVYMTKGKIDTAIEFFKKSYAINFRNTYEMGDALLVHIKLADAYFQKGDMTALSATLAAIAKEMDTVQHSLKTDRDWNEVMYRYFEKAGKAAEALKYHKAYVMLKDSLNEITQRELQADVSKSLKQKEQLYQISLLQKENKLSNIYLLVVIMALLTTVVMITQVYISYRKGKRNIQALTLLNNQVSEQKAELEIKNKEKDRILHVVAHDLRNPVSGILYLSGEMHAEREEEWNATEIFGMIKGASESAMVLINELLGYTNVIHGEVVKAPADIVKLINDTVKLLEFKASQKEQKLITHLPAEPVIVDVDKERIMRVIANLVGNAIKFSPNGARVDISVLQKDDRIVISVKDTGIGIPPEMADEVFTMFSGAQRFGTAGEKSYGLGLYICKQIVEAHGGSIWFESRENGTVFFVELPQATV